MLATAVQHFLETEGLPGQAILVACSGGPDSLALLHALHRMTPVIAAHLNHQLRGAEGDADEAFVMDFCRSASIPLETARRPVVVEAQAAGANLEAFARQVRYDWLSEIARRRGIQLVATGHTQSDQAETVLFNLLRGTGLRGLRGIARRRELAPGTELIRPLLSVSRAEVETYLAAHDLQARTDSSNADLTFARNRLRHELLPLLRREYNPAADESLTRLAEQAAEVLAAQQARVRLALKDAELPRAGGMVVLNVARLAALERSDLAELFCLIWEREQWPRGSMGKVEYDRLGLLVQGIGSAWDLPDGVRVRRRAHVLQLTRQPS